MTFEVSIRPIQFVSVAAEKFVVYPIIKNPRDNEITDTVELLVGDTVRSKRDFTLLAGQQKEVKLSWKVDVSENKELDVTVRTSSDSASDEGTFLVYDDTIRVRFDEESRDSDISHKEKFIEGTDKIGPDVE